MFGQTDEERTMLVETSRAILETMPSRLPRDERRKRHPVSPGSIVATKHHDCQKTPCLEYHILGAFGPNVFSGDDLLEGNHGTIYGRWNIHRCVYERIEAWYPRVLANCTVVDISEALRQGE